jgi:hypothetical protein
MTKINYRSDFDFILHLRTANGQEAGWPDYDWRARIYTSQKVNAVIVSNIGGELTNCFNDNGSIHAVINNHRLTPGVLHIEFEALIPNGLYPDGDEKVVVPEDLDIELVRQSSDCPTDIEITLILPYIKGDKLTYADLSEDDKADLRAPIKKEVVSVEKELKTHIEESGRKFIGVWDELDNIKELLASVNSREVNTLLEKLGFTESDIEEYIYANLHLGLGLTMDDLRESAWRWNHFDELDKPVSFPVLPKMSLELEKRFGGFKDFLESVDAGSVKYLPQIVMSENYLVMEKYGIKIDEYFSNAVYHGGINYLNESKPIMLSFRSQVISGIGTIEGNVCSITNGHTPRLRYVKGLHTTYTGYTFLRKAFYHNNAGFYSVSLSDISGLEIPLGAYADEAFARNFYEPLVALKIGNWDFEGISSVQNMFYNQMLKNETFEFSLEGFSNMESFISHSSPYNLFHHTILDSCTIKLPNAENAYNINRMALSKFGEITASGLNRIIAPKLQCVDMWSFYSFGRHFNWSPIGMFVIECPEAQELIFNSGFSEAYSVIPAMVGKNIPDNTVIALKYGMDSLFKYLDDGRTDQLKGWFNKALDTWYDRKSAGLGYVLIDMSKWQWNLLDEDTILNLGDKGYSITVDQYY